MGSGGFALSGEDLYPVAVEDMLELNSSFVDLAAERASKKDNLKPKCFSSPHGNDLSKYLSKSSPLAFVL